MRTTVITEILYDVVIAVVATDVEPPDDGVATGLRLGAETGRVGVVTFPLSDVGADTGAVTFPSSDVGADTGVSVSSVVVVGAATGVSVVVPVVGAVATGAATGTSAGPSVATNVHVSGQLITTRHSQTSGKVTVVSPGATPKLPSTIVALHDPHDDGSGTKGKHGTGVAIKSARGHVTLPKPV